MFNGFFPDWNRTGFEGILPDMDTEYMRAALEEAKKAYSRGEVPVGAVVVDASKNIISYAHNETESIHLATAHAEMLAIERASKKLKRWRLTGCTLYTTLEPCPMCMGALQLSRIDRVVFAAPDLRLGALGSFVDLSEKKHPFHNIECEGGVLSDESAALMRAFFKERRSSACNMGLGVS